MIFSPNSGPTAARLATAAMDQKHRTQLNHLQLEAEVLRVPPAVAASMKTPQKREWTEVFTQLKLSQKFSVLVVDDVPEHVQTTCAILNTFVNVTTEGAYGGEEAVKKVRQRMDNQSMYHLILTDLVMPYNGYDTTRDIRSEEKKRKTRPKYCIVGVTAEKISFSNDVKALQCGMDDTVSKPLYFQVLREIIEKRARDLGINFKVEINND